jgi:mono/diheme cytochrome c family protein
VTQVPEYLLERSRARRAALGLGGDESSSSSASAPAEAPPSEGSASGDGGGSSAPAVAESAAPAATATATAPARTEPAAPAAPAEPLPDYIRDPGPRSGIPYWMMPVLLILPLWGIVYMGAFGEVAQPELSPAEMGRQVYARSCASCHGQNGEGGVGPKLSGGESRKTFPNEADQIAWVETGSATKRGQPYGDPGREGGPKVANTGGMPGFAGQLSPAEIAAVVTHEREALG